MDYKFELVEQKEQPVLSMRMVTSVEKLPEELGKAYGAIMGYLEEIGEKPVDAPFAAYYNMDMEKLDVEMGFPVERVLAGKGAIKEGCIPAGKQVSCLFKGPYMESGPVYEAMNRWITDNGHMTTGVVYEVYLNSPMEVPESELQTRIVFPLK